MMQAVEFSTAPVIASHSATSALAPHARNLTNAQMEALAARGGLLQVVAFPDYVEINEARRAAFLALREKVASAAGDARFSYTKHGKMEDWIEGVRQIEAEYPRPSLSIFVDHIDHAVQIMGIDHVGISSDFGGGGGVVGWNDASETLNVTAELIRRGYSEEDIAKLWGQNLLRVWREVGAAASEKP